MSSWRVNASTKIRKPLNLAFAVSLFGLASTAGSPTMAQQGPPSGVIPEIAIRQPNRQMDHYDRELDRFKVAAMISGRKRALLALIKEDFEGIQAIHNEMLEMIQAEEALKYDRLIELTSQMKKRTLRLGTNLALPPPPGSKDNTKAQASANTDGVKESFFTLHDVLVSFVTNPIFKNLRLFDASDVNRASEDLNEIVLLSDKIKKSAKVLRQETTSRRQ
jgi:hypothetical protein